MAESTNTDQIADLKDAWQAAESLQEGARNVFEAYPDNTTLAAWMRTEGVAVAARQDLHSAIRYDGIAWMDREAELL